MVWQLVVLPGAQMVTEVYGVLMLGEGPGPASTMIVATLLAAPAITLPPVVLVAVLAPLCPLQAARAIAALQIKIAVPRFMANTYRSSSIETPGGTALARYARPAKARIWPLETSTRSPRCAARC